MRTRVYRFIILLFFAFLSLGLFFVQVIQGGHFFEMGLRNSIRLIPEAPYRGRIFDRNNILMVDNILSFNVVVIPQEVKDKDALFEKLSGILSLDKEEIWQRYQKGYLNPFSPVSMAKGVSKTEAITVEEQRLDLSGVRIDFNVGRFYPYGSIASHVLGHMGEIDRSRITKLKDYGYDIKDQMGYGGLEEVLDIYLRGEKGGQQIEVDNQGRQVRLLGYKPPHRGIDVQVTIDLELQQVSDRLLEGRKGAIVLMDVASGKVLVMSSAPTFDPNVFVDRRDIKLLNYFLNSEDAPLFNRAIGGQFPPASTFKIITAAAALKDQKISPSTTFVCNGQYKVGNRFFKCWSVHGPQDFYQAMAHSCDIYFYHLGLIAGPVNIASTAREFGLAGLTGIDLPNEAKGFIPTPVWKRLAHLENWYNGDTINLAIGQGYLLVTPLQLARSMAAVANGGYLVEPYLTKSIGSEDIVPKKPKKIKIAQEDLTLIKESLRLAVSLETGTAHTLDVEGLEICAKTGTAQMVGQEPHGWVAGFFPKGKPQYAFCILLENVGSSYYACLLAKELLEEGLKRNKF